MDEKIMRFLSKRTKTSQVLRALIQKESITNLEIINLVCCTSPHSLIRDIRKEFGKDFVQDKEIQFKRTYYDMDGKPYKQTDTYKKYFIDKGKLEDI